jgi:F0F1-type ATP synthase assembly protein I
MQGRDRREAWRGADQAWEIIGLLLAGILVWGGIGWLLDRLFDFTDVLLPIGMLLGAGVSIWLVSRKYGNPEQPT